MLDLHDEREVLRAALAEVPEEFRVPVVMRDVGDLDYAEIAEQLGVPVGTVKSRIARGRAALSAAYRARVAEVEPPSDVGNRPRTDERPSPER